MKHIAYQTCEFFSLTDPILIYMKFQMTSNYLETVGIQRVFISRSRFSRVGEFRLTQNFGTSYVLYIIYQSKFLFC